MRDTASSAFALPLRLEQHDALNADIQRTALAAGKVVTGAQLRAGRALLGWSSQTLATAARVHINTIGRWEAARTLPAFLLREPYGVRRMREAMESAGVKFFIRPSPGVRLCKGPSFVMPPARRLRPLHGVPRFLQLSCDRRPKTPVHRTNGPARLCGARTRVGRTCRRRPMPNGDAACTAVPRQDQGRRQDGHDCQSCRNDAGPSGAAIKTKRT